MIVAGGPNPFVLFASLALLVVQVWLFGRFFINVLFWQQFAVLENATVPESLQRSKDLARSGRELPWYRRPLWRGALLTSIWVAIVLAIAIGPQWSTISDYWSQALTIQDPQILLQKLSASDQARRFDYLVFGLNILQKLLQPLLGIAFVVLYFDSKTERD